MRVQDISGKDVRNMKECSLLKRGPNSVGQARQIEDLRGGRGVQGSDIYLYIHIHMYVYIYVHINICIYICIYI